MLLQSGHDFAEPLLIVDHATGTTLAFTGLCFYRVECGGRFEHQFLETKQTCLDAATQTHLLGDVSFRGKRVGTLWHRTFVLTCNPGNIWLKYTLTTSGCDDLETVEFEFRNALPVDIMVGKGVPYTVFGSVQSLLGMSSKDGCKWV